MALTWKPFSDECPHCGCDAEVLTCSTEPNVAYDGEQARCGECGLPGSVRVEEDGEGWIHWHDGPNCGCEWCELHDDTNCTAPGCPAAA